MKIHEDTFLNRIKSIPYHGIGLSVDLHDPDLFELVPSLAHSFLPIDYLEIYRGPLSHFKPLRNIVYDTLPLEYHADFLWFTQPDFRNTPWKKECDKIIQTTAFLKSDWITHECAAKQIAGFPFGTYLPPLLTEGSGELIGRQSSEIQNYIAINWKNFDENAPLFLIEVPPFYTFTIGDLSLSLFFNSIANHCSCGFLLDIGHVYTYYLSSGQRESVSINNFFRTFLEEFPLERVVQIHVGGLRQFEQTFLDDHGAKIPEVLFQLLKITLENPRLIHLKGIALEVDTKEINVIIDEYRRFRTVGLPWKEGIKSKN